MRQLKSTLNTPNVKDPTASLKYSNTTVDSDHSIMGHMTHENLLLPELHLLVLDYHA